MGMPSCGGCRYYVTLSKTSGECRRYPPFTLNPVNGANLYAKTTPAQWCGEFNARISYGDDRGRALAVPPRSLMEDR